MNPNSSDGSNIPPPPRYLSNEHIQPEHIPIITKLLKITGLQGDCTYNPNRNESPKILVESPDKERLKTILSAIADWVQESNSFTNPPHYMIEGLRNNQAFVALEDITEYALRPADWTKITDPWARLEEILQKKLEQPSQNPMEALFRITEQDGR
ncbi:MAG: hypothetical protein ACK53X_07815 [Holosporales bacterium]